VIARVLACALGVLSVAACGGKTFDEPLVLGGKTVAPATLNDGEAVFVRFCATCHGYDGKADTPAARRLDPPPRDLRIGDFRHASAGPGALPSDADLRRIVREGIPATGMPAWPNLDDDQIEAVIQYIKTFSARWRDSAAAPVTEGALGLRTMLPNGADAASFRPGQWRGAQADQALAVHDVVVATTAVAPPTCSLAQQLPGAAAGAATSGRCTVLRER
jgi:mono/diheme cytochrome c family protein